MRFEMKKSWIGKIAKISLIAIVLMAVCFGTKQVSALGVDDVFNAGNSWIGMGTPDGSDPETFVEDFLVVGQILVSITIAVVLVVTVITAAQWIVATPDQQAKLKQRLIGLAVSIVVIFGAVGIWTIARNILRNSLGE